MPSESVQALCDEALAGLSPDRAVAMSGRIDAMLSQPDLTPGDRGCLLSARAIAAQHFEPLPNVRLGLNEAISLLESSGETAHQVHALTSLAAVDLMLGEYRSCMEHAVRALSAIGLDEFGATSPRVTGNLSLVFNEFSAFELSYHLAKASFDSVVNHDPNGLLLMAGFTFARTITEAVWHDDENTTAVRRLGEATAVGERLIAEADRAEGSSKLIHLLSGQLILAEVALLRSDLDEAQIQIDLALAAPEGSQPLLQGYVYLVAAIIDRRRGRIHEALAHLDAAEGPMATEVHHLDRMLAERSACHAALGEYELAYQHASSRADAASRRYGRSMGAAIEQIRARARAEQLGIALTERNRSDALTGVSSRGWFDTSLDARSASDDDLAVILIDIDRFKSINDRYSHQAGDAVLRRIGAILQDLCGDEDHVARYGGEEFVVLPASGDVDAAVDLAERVRSSIESERWSGIADGLTVTASAGVAAGAAHEAEATLHAADVALYRAKADGRNRVVVRGQPIA